MQVHANDVLKHSFEIHVQVCLSAFLYAEQI